MKLRSFVYLSAILLSGCKSSFNDDPLMVFIIIDEKTERDGLYLNTRDPDILIQKHNGEVLRYFNEFDKKKRRPIDYSDAHKIYESRFRDSYFELFPSDLNYPDTALAYDALLIDIVNKTAFINKIGPSSRIY
jgi:hypothetical protein